MRPASRKSDASSWLGVGRGEELFAVENRVGARVKAQELRLARDFGAARERRTIARGMSTRAANTNGTK